MKRRSTGDARRSLLLTLFVLGIATAVVILPTQFRSSATGRSGGEGLLSRTVSHDDSIPNYDIRSDKGAFEKIAGFRDSLGRNAVDVANIRDEFINGEASLKSRVPTLKVEYNLDIRIPEVIAPDVKQGRAMLTGSSGAKRSDILKNFLKENTSLTGVSAGQIDGLRVTADYTNPDGNLSFALLEQELNGIPVFRGEVKAGFTKSGEMIRVINNLAPGIDAGSLSTNFGDPANAVRAAAGHIKHQLTPADQSLNTPESTDEKVVFGSGDWATTAEKIYFPTEPGVAVPSWRVLIWEPANAYYVIVDGATGTMLWRKNITEDQTQSATYNVYANPNAMVNSADSPAPLTPGPIDPNLGTQGALITRTNITRIGNEAPYTFNNNGWITDGANITDGNAVEAGIDRDGTNGVDAPQTGAPNRVFDSTWNPPPGNPAPGDEPLTAQAQRGAVIQMFYTMNLYHDELYRLGFTELAFNFQNDNFGRGGAGADRVSAEGQDSSGTNNANFSTPADGGRGRMQMFLWTGPTPDKDGTTDIDVVYHEVTHGTSNRLHGNSAGLSTNMARGMGEGWSDFYAHAMLSEPTDPINGVYSLGGYATHLVTAGFTGNYYYGIRRFPKAVMAFTGGPMNRPHNPLTFADLNAGCVLSDGAFPRGPIGVAQCDQVHNAGEIWSSALWEVRAKFITRLGWAAGNRKTLQLVTDGMKLAPLGPTFLQERDAIIAAAQASALTPEAAADVTDVWGGFAIRGMGFSASVTAAGPPAVVVESFDPPGALIGTPITVSDSTGDGDGFPEPGEALLVSVPVQNVGTAAATVSVTVTGGGTVNYGSVAPGATVTNNIPYTVPAGATCGSTHTLNITGTSSTGPMSPRTISFTLGRLAAPSFTENFDGVTAPGLPAGWTAVPTLGTLNFATVTTSADTAPNSVYANDPAAGASGTDLTSPTIAIPANGTALTFRHRFDTEPAWDGGLVEISINGGAFTDISLNGGSFVTNGYNSLMTAAAPSPTYVPNPLNGRNGWTGLSTGFITTTVNLPPAALGQNVRLKWRFGADDNTTGTGANPGWYVDTVSIASYECSVGPVAPVRSRADFDGDGKTDYSIFRPSEGNWYLQRSTAGFAALNWGISTDTLVPGDYDGDGKTDTAVFRPTADPAAADFYVLNSNGFTMSGFSWGVSGDIPVNRDYDADGKTDIGIFRPSNNTWYIIKSTGGQQLRELGQAGDIPVPGDYNGDNKGDYALYRGGTWVIEYSSGGTAFNTAHGAAGDRLVPADYDGDNKDDIAVFRPSTGTWMILKSTGGTQNTPWGASGDVPVPGDFDGDGKDDPAIYRGGTWWVLQSTAGATTFGFGVGSDTPVPGEYLP